ncbi:MAG: hypothetical protein M0P27_01745 [Bacteroidales bacterium]|nr:hypothetical protein [Bacteroidales bacterium]
MNTCVTLSNPIDQSEWTVTGFQDALNNALMLSVFCENGKTHYIPFVSAPALVMLKIIALNDRPDDRAQKDADDIAFVIRHYLEIGNRARLKAHPDSDIIASVGSDIELASATLIGRDMREMASPDSSEYILKILDAEIESNSRCYLTRGIKNELCKGDFNRARTILKSLRAGLMR